MLYEDSIKDFVKKLADKTPVPGGGSAGALSAAMGCALGLMCMRFSESLSKEHDELEKITASLVENIDKDSEAYERVAEAYKLPVKTAQRKEKIQSTLKIAANVPFEGVKLINRALEILFVSRERANKRLFSDLASATELLACSSKILWYNVMTNLNSMTDRELINRLKTEGERILKGIEQKHDKILEDVYEVLKP